MTDTSQNQQLDATGLQCPMPLLKTRQALRHLKQGEQLAVLVTDPASVDDIPAYLRQSCHTLVRIERHTAHTVIVILRGEQAS